MLFSACLMLLGSFGSFNAVQEWDFTDAGVTTVWQANAHFADLAVKEDGLHTHAVAWDPFFTCTAVDIAASPSQCVLIRIKADMAGRGQLFWTGDTSGQYGGLSESKRTDFSVAASDEYQDIYLFPFWHTEKNIRGLRLDLYEGGTFAIQRVAILERSEAAVTAATTWHPVNEANGWNVLNKSTLLTSPPLSVSTTNVGWLSLALDAKEDTTVSLEWSTDVLLGSKQETIYVKQHEGLRRYYIEIQGNKEWTGNLVGLNLHIADPAKISVDRIALTTEPDGPPEIEVAYFGFENGVSRAGRPESLLAQLINRGGGNAVIKDVVLERPAGVTVVSGPNYSATTPLQNGDSVDILWQVQAETAAQYSVTLKPDATTPVCDATLTFMPAVEMKADYVPEPKPLKTSLEVCAYYFPGWNADVKYDCLRNTAPIRKPLLGYYDESNPECVDWQIKWAVENGISCFLVDWYWVAGNQHLFHWFDAYRKARYRDYLKVAIMWANHNPQGTHSREDWRNVTREWIDKYFSLPGYYKVNGKPAVFLWDSNLIRGDLGGSDAVAEAFAESRQMAKDAGHAGIEFIILQHHANEADMQKWQAETYDGNTTYHEFGSALDMASHQSQGQYADVVATAPAAWEKRRQQSGAFPFYPIVDTGWDSRPWHGPNSMAFHGRTPELFKQFLQAGKEYCAEHDVPFLILGPLNEWGEGSYIEPNLEFGFTMYEAIREVFGEGNPKEWPQNLSPRDTGLGPYDFPRTPQKTTWEFNTDAEGWAAMMSISDLTVKEGNLEFHTTSSDPALIASTPGLRASEYPTLNIRMKIQVGSDKVGSGQLFWSIGSSNTSEANSVRFELQGDGEFHKYTLNLGEHPRWRGRINALRFDPCDVANANITLDYIRFGR
jgi:hypothetical protein